MKHYFAAAERLKGDSLDVPTSKATQSEPPATMKNAIPAPQGVSSVGYEDPREMGMVEG